MDASGEIYAYPFIDINTSTDNFILHFLIGSSTFPSVTSCRHATSHACFDNYKSACKKNFLQKQLGNTIDVIKKLTIKQKKSKTPNQGKRTLVNSQSKNIASSQLPRKWKDPKRCGRADAKQQRSITKHNKNRRKPKQPKIAHSHSLFGSTHFIADFVRVLFNKDNTSQTIHKAMSNTFDEYCLSAGWCFVPITELLSQIASLGKSPITLEFLSLVTRFGVMINCITNINDLNTSWGVMYLWLGPTEWNLISSCVRAFNHLSSRAYTQLHSAIAKSHSGDELSADSSSFSQYCTDNDLIPLTFLRELVGNWDGLRNNTLFKHLRELFLASIALQLIDISGLSNEKQQLLNTLFPVINKRTYTATSLIDSFLHTIVIVGENINKCVREGSIYPLLGTSRNMQNLEQRFKRIHEINCFVGYNANKFEDFGITADEFVADARDLRQDLIYYRSDLRDGFATMRIDRHCKELCEIAAQATSKYLIGTNRDAPFTIGLYGGTSVGKSVIAPALLHFIFASNGIKATSENAIARVDLADKYESNLYPDTIGLIIDDVANTIAERNNGIAVTERILRYVNNMPATAVKADLKDKATVPIRPKAVVMTSNLVDFGAKTYSIEPLSITRRCDVCIEVELRPEFSTPEGTLNKALMSTYSKGTWVDAFLFTIYHFQRDPLDPSKLSRVTGLMHTLPDGTPLSLTNMGWQSLFKYLDDVSHKHYINQSHITSSDADLRDMCAICQVCRVPSQFCTCSSLTTNDESSYHTGDFDFDFAPSVADMPHSEEFVAEQHSGFENTGWVSACWQWIRKRCSSRFRLISSHEGMSSDEVRIGENRNSAIAYFDRLYNNVIFRVASLLPDTEYIAQKVIRVSRWQCSQFFASNEPNAWRYALGAFATTGALCVGLSVVAIPIGCATGLSLALDVCVCKFRQLRIAALSFGSRVVSSCAFDYISANWIKITMWSSVSLATLFVCSNIAKRVLYARRHVSHGNLNPKHVSEVRARDTEDSPWQKAHQVRSSFIRTEGMVREDFLRIVHDNVRRLVFHDIRMNQRPKCQCLMVQGNFGLIPAHAVRNFTDGHVMVSQGPENSTLGSFESLLDRSMLYQFPNTDICLISFSRSNQCRDITAFFSSQAQDVHYGALLSKDSDNFDATWECNIQSFSDSLHTTGMMCSGFSGYTSFLHGDVKSYQGLCGAPLVSYDSPMCILGLHLGAVYDKDNPYKECLAGTISPKQISDGITVLCESPLVHSHASWGEVPDQLYGKNVLSNTVVHPKSAVCFQKKGAVATTVMHLGSGSHPMKYRSKCVQTPISAFVRDLFNIHDCWDGPAFHKDWIFNVDYLVHAAKCPMGLPCSHVSFAYADYLKQVEEGIDVSFFQAAKPLSEIANVNGIPQCRFIDALTMTTSVGYPINRPKTEFVGDVDVSNELYHGYQHPRSLDGQFFKEASRCEKLLLKGERPMCIFYASLKDEPTKTTKTKVRIFQSAPLALSLLVRKYFLPIARIFSCNPLVTECAVGISAEGPEWYQWDSHIFKFGPSRVLAGDFSKYDLRMPAQLSTLALKIMVHCATLCPQYSADDIKIMNGLVTELSYPLVHLNGDVVGLLGSNPSGHNLTVYVNSVVNSLIFRCAYFASQQHLNKQHVRPFRTICAASFYGDDAIATVNKCLAKTFCFRQMKEYLETHGIVFTPPDKSEDKDITFFHKDSVDFLKRKTVYVPEIFLPVGALCEDSILKSLCCVLKGAESVEAVTQSNLTLAARTFFYHGRTVFDDKIRLLRLLAESQGWSPVILHLDYEFDDWARIHMQSHRREYISLYNLERASGKYVGSCANIWFQSIIDKYPYYFDPSSISFHDYMRENILFQPLQTPAQHGRKLQRDVQITGGVTGANPRVFHEHASCTVDRLYLQSVCHAHTQLARKTGSSESQYLLNS